MQQTIANLPPYLQRFCVEQSRVTYTPRDQAAWRYIMKQSRAFFKDHGVPIYLEGLKKTGVTTESIPSIASMDLRLKELGWGAVPVCGFIPPAAFLDFQARRILPIAADMRSADHIHYTPAPDIVHEAAGHAPVIADSAYSDYLTKYAAMAQKAIFSHEDLDLYEAIRSLSDIKENPDSTPAMIKEADLNLEKAVKATTFVSEAAKVARMNWWTVEYGLLGSLASPKIYGAGLLSSVGESQACLSAKVRKIRLTTACIETAYDITEPQPQLFVAEDIRHLTDVLEEFERTLSFHRGGTYGLEQARQGRTVTCTELDSGLSISGQLTEFKTSTNGDVEFVRYGGPVQLAGDGKELPGQGIKHHPQGFSSPIGRFKNKSEKAPHLLSDRELASIGIEPGKRAVLEFRSGFKVEGVVAETTRLAGRLAIIKWRDCRVTRQSELFFDPAWGDFDMAVGEKVLAVSGGPADRESFGSHDVGQATTTPGRKTPFTTEEKAAFALYHDLRTLREEITAAGGSNAPEPQKALWLERLGRLVEVARRDFKNEWLLRIECLELFYLLSKDGQGPSLFNPAKEQEALLTEARQKESQDENISWLIRQGVQLASQFH